MMPHWFHVDHQLGDRMLRYKFLRYSFFFSLIGTLLVPLYTLFIAFPNLTHLLLFQAEQTSARIATHLRHQISMDAVNRDNLVVSPLLKEEIVQLAKDFGILKSRVYDSRGQMIFSTESGEGGRRIDEEFFVNRVANGLNYSEVVSKEESTREGEHFASDVVETYIPIMYQNQFYGAFEIYLDLPREKAAMDRMVLEGGVIVSTLSLALVLLILYVRHSVVTPVARISQAMNRMIQGDLDHRVPEVGRDEIGDLARVFNQMCQRLQYAHLSLEQERDKLNTILLGAQEGIVSTNSSGTIVLVNPAAETLLGKTRDQMVREGFLQLLDDPEFLVATMERSGIDTPSTLVFNQKVLCVQAASIHTAQGGLIGSVALLRDITAEKQLEDKLRSLSYTDALTGLLNRRRLDELLLNEWNRAKRYAIGFSFMIIDVDHFKRFNDDHGHDQGDRVLVALARLMQGHFRTVDYCCRYGGEEFAVILPNTRAEQVLEAAERLRQKVASMEVDGLKVTISVGLSHYVPECTVGQLVKAADKALYRVKGEGRNGVAFQEP